MHHKEIIHLTIAYTIVGAFIFTVIITCLSIVGWIKFADNAQQQKLFYVLIVEVVVGIVGYFFNWLDFNPKSTSNAIANRVADKLEEIHESNVEGSKINQIGNPQNWNPNNRSQKTTWLTLKLLAQIDRNLYFKECGTLKNTQLTFWNKSASKKIREIQAEALVVIMDNVFRDIRGAEFRKGMNKEKGIKIIKESLLDSEKTVSDLAEINKSIYKFWGENG
ncbi:MAG: hypothetical protein Q8M94_02850 [Ignavibacteria bacterium]|nr:hypothetical protein [Ignavibacteria bacterium]